MRYQLRYIRVPRARSSPVAVGNISRRERRGTNPLARGCFVHGGTRADGVEVDARCRPVDPRRGCAGGRARTGPDGAGIEPSTGFLVCVHGVLIFLGHPATAGGISRSRSSVGERPPHTRKVAGSKPAGTTTTSSRVPWHSLPLLAMRRVLHPGCPRRHDTTPLQTSRDGRRVLRQGRGGRMPTTKAQTSREVRRVLRQGCARIPFTTLTQKSTPVVAQPVAPRAARRRHVDVVARCR